MSNQVPQFAYAPGLSINRQQILEIASIETLLDGRSVHIISARLMAPDEKAHVSHEFLIAADRGGRDLRVMEMDGALLRPGLELRDIKPAHEPKYYADYPRLLPFHLRHVPLAPPEFDNHVVLETKGNVTHIKERHKTHLLTADFSLLSGHRWQREVVIEDGRRIVSVDGMNLKNGATSIDGKATGDVIQGCQVIGLTPLRPENAQFYKRQSAAPAEQRATYQ